MNPGSWFVAEMWMAPPPWKPRPPSRKLSAISFVTWAFGVFGKLGAEPFWPLPPCRTPQYPSEFGVVMVQMLDSPIAAQRIATRQHMGAFFASQTDIRISTLCRWSGLHVVPPIFMADAVAPVAFDFFFWAAVSLTIGASTACLMPISGQKNCPRGSFGYRLALSPESRTSF